MSVTLAWHYFGVRVVTLTCSVPIESLDLHKNEVSGTIPSEVGLLTNLGTLPSAFILLAPRHNCSSPK
jgi:hypothetical protein